MKRIFHIITFLSIILIGGSSCTHNNGDIGPLFGNWKITSIDINGVPDASYKGNIFFAFQNDVTNMKAIYDDHSYSECYGRWEIDGDNLILTYNDTRLYPLKESYLSVGTNICHIIQLTNKDMKLSMTNSEATYTYTLIKW